MGINVRNRGSDGCMIETQTYKYIFTMQCVWWGHWACPRCQWQGVRFQSLDARSLPSVLDSDTVIRRATVRDAQARDEVSQARDEVSQAKDEVSQARDNISQARNLVSQSWDQRSASWHATLRVVDSLLGGLEFTSQALRYIG